MRYIEQLRSSWSYHWKILCEIWDGFTLHNWHWYIVGAFFAIGIVPIVVEGLAPAMARYYYIIKKPTFAPSLSQELAMTEYVRVMRAKPSFIWLFSHYWVQSDAFHLVSEALCWTSAALLLIAWFREK